VEVVAQGDTDGVITSGGGFSEYYPVPSWQRSSISTYFTHAAAAGHTPALGYGAGRGFPDVSLAGVSYAVIIGGGSGTVCGTSASAPAVAAFFSNVNAARMALGKGSVGFVNPALYAHGGSFMNDIVSGNNRCVVGGTCCPQGYYAGPGWDPACGLGSPNYGKMHHILVALGNEINGAQFAPSWKPTVMPTTAAPSFTPTKKPSFKPSTSIPSSTPTIAPSAPTYSPTTASPSISFTPTSTPTSSAPTESPTNDPTSSPTWAPTLAPAFEPAISPKYFPTMGPTDLSVPTFRPSLEALSVFDKTTDGETIHGRVEIVEWSRVEWSGVRCSVLQNSVTCIKAQYSAV
jgi:hypothetical protein